MSGFPWDFATPGGLIELETVKYCLFVQQLFRCNTVALDRQDGRTDGRTEMVNRDRAVIMLTGDNNELLAVKLCVYNTVTN